MIYPQTYNNSTETHTDNRMYIEDHEMKRLFDEEDILLPLPERNLSVEELEKLILDDIHHIYEMK